MKSAPLANTECFLSVPPILDVTRAGGHQVVHLGATPIACFPVSDVSTRRHVMVQLAAAGAVKTVDIAAAFKVTPIYVSLLRGRYREQGSAGLQAGRRGPHGPIKLTPLMERRILELDKKGLSHRGIAQRLTDSGKKISYQTVRRILLRRLPQQKCLPVIREPEPETPLCVLAPAVGEGSEAVPQGPTRYAGAMLLHVALGQLGLSGATARSRTLTVFVPRPDFVARRVARVDWSVTSWPAVAVWFARSAAVGGVIRCSAASSA